MSRKVPGQKKSPSRQRGRTVFVRSQHRHTHVPEWVYFSTYFPKVKFFLFSDDGRDGGAEGVRGLGHAGIVQCVGRINWVVIV